MGGIGWLFGGGQASTWNGDWELMGSLGLERNFNRDWTDVGTVEMTDTTVKVEVSAMPAQFFRFTITRPDGQIVIASTGSGSFGEYWEHVRLYVLTGRWSAEALALSKQNMFVVEDG